MIYVTSDLHGCHPTVFRQLLDRADFGEDDFLFVLGDVIDRGEYGAELLLWLTEQPNIQLILGNHEAMLLACGFLFEEVTDESLNRLTGEQIGLAANWVMNGGDPTMKGFRRLFRQDPELVAGILDYLRATGHADAVNVPENAEQFVTQARLQAGVRFQLLEEGL